MGKHDSQGAAEPVPQDTTAAGTGTGATTGEALTAPTSRAAPSLGSTKKPDAPYCAPHEGGKA
jgi:hypothetical protein